MAICMECYRCVVSLQFFLLLKYEPRNLNQYWRVLKNKLIKANKSLLILRRLRKEGYKQSEIDLLINTLVLPNNNSALSVYPASDTDLTLVRCFLDHCFKRKYTSKPVSVFDFLERQNRKIFRKVSDSTGHPLLSIMPLVKPSRYHLRKETCYKPKINTMRFNNSFINRLVFGYELARLYTRF